MEEKLFSGLDEILMELERGIGMITVVADGLECYTRHSALTGLQAEAYMNTIVVAKDVLSEATQRLQDAMSGVVAAEKKKEVAA